MRFSFDSIYGASSNWFEFGDIAIRNSYSLGPFMPHISLPHVVASVDFSVVWIFVGKEGGILSMAVTLFEERDSTKIHFIILLEIHCRYITLEPNVSVLYDSSACETIILCAIIVWVVIVELGVNFCSAPVGVHFVVKSFVPEVEPFALL